MERRLSDVYSWARHRINYIEERDTRGWKKDCRKGSKSWRAWYSWSRRSHSGDYEGLGLNESDISCSVVTGYGRNKYEGCDLEVSELTCHALGSQIIFPEVRTVIDIGGQDAKVICLNDSGRMTNFVMNDKCAAGTGRFLDVMANILRADISELEVLASKADSPATISSTCTVFAESEVISQLANGESRENVIAGICNSVVSRVSSLARRAGVKEKVCMSGGVAKNGAVRDAMSKALEVQIEYDSLAQYFGAIGAAVYAFRSNKK